MGENAGFSVLREVVTKTGERIILDGEDNRIIAPSVRPDGSIRKHIRIRPGFIREEEVQKFVTKGSMFRQRVEELKATGYPINYVPLSTSPISGGIKKKKKKKKKNAKKEDCPVGGEKIVMVDTIAFEADDEEKENIFTNRVKMVDIDQSITTGDVNYPSSIETGNSRSDLKDHISENNGGVIESWENHDLRRIRNVKKKLAQISTLESKIGEGVIPTIEQSQKLKKKKALRKELRELEELQNLERKDTRVSINCVDAEPDQPSFLK